MEEETPQTIKLEESEIVTFTMAEKRWSDFKEVIGDDIFHEKCAGYSVLGHFEEKEFVKQFNMSNLFIGSLVETEAETIIYHWDWCVDAGRTPEDQELIDKVRKKIEDEYELSQDSFYTTNEVLIRYIIATATVELELDYITTEDTETNAFVLGHKIIVEI